MTTNFLTTPTMRIALLALASVALSLGFACAVPLAAFAAIAAFVFARREARIAILAVWFVNQFVGFASLHYPLDQTTLAWGGALGVVALLACEAARFAQRGAGAIDAAAAFLAAFVAYEGALVLIDVATGQDAEFYTVATITRVFLINVCAFGVLWAGHALVAAKKADKEVARNVLPQHAK